MTSLRITPTTGLYGPKSKDIAIRYSRFAEDETVRKVMVVVDRPVFSMKAGVPIGREAELTFRNVVESVLAETEIKGAVYLAALPPTKENEETTIDDRLAVIVRALNPDIVMLAGFNLVRHFHDGYALSFGLIKTLQLPSIKVKSVATIPVPDWCHPTPPVKGENGGGSVNLIGFFADHLNTALAGKMGYSLRDTLPGLAPPRYTFVDTMPLFDRLMTDLTRANIVSIDTETLGLNRVANDIISVQFLMRNKGEKDTLYFLPLRHRECTWLPDEVKQIRRRLRTYFETGESRYHVFQNAKFDLTQLRNSLKIRWYNHKTYNLAAGEYLFNENRKWLTGLGIRPYSLDFLESQYGYVREGAAVSKNDRANMADKPLRDIADYGMIDVVTPMHIHALQIKKAKDRNLPMFLRLVTDQMSATDHVLVEMEHTGIGADREYIQSLLLPESKLEQLIKDAITKFRDSPHVQKVNDYLVSKSGFSSNGLFGDVEKPWIFDLSRTEHKHLLFFKQLRLEPVKTGKGGMPSLDKFFQVRYADVPEVAWLTELGQINKVKSAYIEAFAVRMHTDPDTRITGRIHASYDWRYIITGRLGSHDPNLQQIPTRNAVAKIVKRVFKAETRRILLKADFAAHEIRGLGNCSGDPAIIDLFRIANEALRKLRIAKRDDLEAAIADVAKNGDIHIINVKRLFGKDVTKSDPLRQSIKTAVFQALYGGGPAALGRQIRDQEIDVLRRRIKSSADTEKAQLKKELDRVSSLPEDYWTDHARKIVDAMWKSWNVAKGWMGDVGKGVLAHQTAESPIGFIRHLDASLHANESVIAAMRRRGPNAIIQGLSSQIGLMAARCMQREAWNTFVRKKLPTPIRLTNIVHDSSLNEPLIEMLPATIYLVEHAMTTLVMRHYKDVYAFDMMARVPLAFDFEIGFNEAEMFKWADLRFATLAEALPDLLKSNKVTRSIRDNTMHNLEAIRRVRERELRKDPYTMTLEGNSDWYRDNFRLSASAG